MGEEERDEEDRKTKEIEKFGILPSIDNYECLYRREIINANTN